MRAIATLIAVMLIGGCSRLPDVVHASGDGAVTYSRSLPQAASPAALPSASTPELFDPSDPVSNLGFLSDDLHNTAGTITGLRSIRTALLEIGADGEMWAAELEALDQTVVTFNAQHTAVQEAITELESRPSGVFRDNLLAVTGVPDDLADAMHRVRLLDGRVRQLRSHIDSLTVFGRSESEQLQAEVAGVRQELADLSNVLQRLAERLPTVSDRVP